MKTTTIFSHLPAIVTAAIFCSSASANLALPQIEIHSQLAQEAVDIRINGDQAVVTGTFQFVKTLEDFYDLTFYLPVYAAEGVPTADFMPEIRLDDRKLEVIYVIKEWEDDRNIRGFGKLPQLDGQVVHWFMIPHVPQQPNQKEMTLKIRYTQKLSNHKFIYTPLLPHAKEGTDYGSITVSADRPLILQDSDKHRFVKEGDKLVVEPADKRAIIVEAVKAPSKLP